MYKYIGFICMACLVLVACEPDKGVVPFDYPDSEIYFPAALAGTYVIDALNDKDKPTATDPEAGVYKYVADKERNVFGIPLAVYRSGIHPDGVVPLEIVLNEDTVNAMIKNGELAETLLLPADKYRLSVNKLSLASGERTAYFSVEVDFAFLYANVGTKYAFALEIVGGKSSFGLNKVVVVIDTRMLIPSAAFKTTVDGTNHKLIYFANNSENIVSCLWDFGDGTSSAEAAPMHEYNADGTYHVRLTATGLYGNQVMTEADIVVVAPQQ